VRAYVLKLFCHRSLKNISYAEINTVCQHNKSVHVFVTEIILANNLSQPIVWFQMYLTTLSHVLNSCSVELKGDIELWLGRTNEGNACGIF
jgi:hypothetical protein